MISEQQKWLNKAINSLRKHANSLAVFIVANVREVTVIKNDYSGFSVQNDYMTGKAVQEIVESLRNIGVYVELFVGETQFIKAFLAGSIEKVDRENKLVWNMAQSGTGPARKSLIPCFCNLHHMTFCNSDGHVVALLRHKYHATSILKAHGILVPRTWLYVPEHGWLDQHAPPQGLKVIVKPTYEAACIGITKECVRFCDETLEGFVRDHARTMRQPMTVQEFVSGYEIDVPVFFTPEAFAPKVLGVSVAGMDHLGDDILDYEKLSNHEYDFFDFSQINPTASIDIALTAERAANILGIQGYGRIDFRCTEAGQFFVIDMQTMPDIHSQSSTHKVISELIESDNSVYEALIATNCSLLRIFNSH
jgi:D-alanine-D-alanine ligase